MDIYFFASNPIIYFFRDGRPKTDVPDMLASIIELLWIKAFTGIIT